MVDQGRGVDEGRGQSDRRVLLYRQVEDTLRAEVAAGAFNPGERFITQREICERFGVSMITAVRALNDLAAEGVLVRRRGIGTFVAEDVTRGVTIGISETADRWPQRSKPEAGQPTIACIVDGLHGLRGSHLAQILVGVESACSAAGYGLILSNVGESSNREAEALRRALDQGVRGIIIYPVQGQSHPEAFAEVRRSGIPLVMIDRYRPDFAADAVVADNVSLGRQVTNKLIDLGHIRIATLWGETDCTSVRDRLSGHLDALSSRGLEIIPEFTVMQPYEPLSEPARLDIMSSLLSATERPSVFLCANGYVLAAAAHDLAALGVRVPGDVQLACMDEAGPYELLPLAGVSGVLPSSLMAAKAMELLVERMNTTDAGWKPARRIVLEVEIDTHTGPLLTVSHSKDLQ